METKTVLIIGGAGLGAYLIWKYALPVVSETLATVVTPTVTSIAPTPTPVLPPPTVSTSGTATVGTFVEGTTPPPNQTSVAVVNTPASLPSGVAGYINGRWPPAIWNKYHGVFDSVSLSVSQIMNATGLSANDANDMIGDLIGNDSGASNRLTYNFGKIIYGKALAANPTKSALMLNGSFTNSQDDSLGDLTSVEGWFTNSSLISGVPNWVMLLAGVAVLKGARVI